MSYFFSTLPRYINSLTRSTCSPLIDRSTTSISRFSGSLRSGSVMSCLVLATLMVRPDSCMVFSKLITSLLSKSSFSANRTRKNQNNQNLCINEEKKIKLVYKTSFTPFRKIALTIHPDKLVTQDFFFRLRR